MRPVFRHIRFTLTVANEPYSFALCGRSILRGAHAGCVQWSDGSSWFWLEMYAQAADSQHGEYGIRMGRRRIDISIWRAAAAARACIECMHALGQCPGCVRCVELSQCMIANACARALGTVRDRSRSRPRAHARRVVVVRRDLGARRGLGRRRRDIRSHTRPADDRAVDVRQRWMGRWMSEPRYPVRELHHCTTREHQRLF